MARVFRRPVPTNNKTEYRGQTINGERRRTRNMEHAKQLIDSSIPAAKEPELHPGGWLKNPPEHCNHIRMDKEGTWAECVMCAFFCMNLQCSGYVLIKGSRRHKKEEIVEESPIEQPKINRRRVRHGQSGV